MQSSIVLLPGDGIGPEVVAAAERVLRLVADRFGHRFEISSYPIGGAALKSGLPPLPEATRAACQEADAVLLGAVGDPAFDSGSSEGRPETGLLQLRQALGVFANLRPAKVWPGMEDGGPFKPELIAGVDLLIVRELLGGIYFGEPRGIAEDGQSAFNTMRYSRPEVERIAEVAFKAAQGRRKLVTSVDKANVLETSRLWREVVGEVAIRYPDVELRHQYVDSCALLVATNPKQFDVLLSGNLFGDIISDEAGAVAGSLGLLPSASLG
ncbi:3-isopropylmalate dehydrogenase, partial [bacterium]|nr:3-isopropylmalate dehydrogenase [bacterium]